MVVLGPFYNRYVKLPPKDQTPPEIQDNPKLYLFFKDCCGAIDGTHINAFVPDDALPQYHNRKGSILQNSLAACTFDMQFVMFFLVGKAVLLMGVYLIMHGGSHLLFHLAHTF